MHLGKPPWAEDLLGSSGVSSTATAESAAPSSSSSLPSVVVDLVKSLNKQRQFREVALALKTAFRDAKAEFSFLRARGLRKLLKLLASVAESETTIQLFRESQSFPELQVVPVLFEHSLTPSRNGPALNSDQVFCGQPMEITSPRTNGEVALALRVLEGCCLFDRDSRTMAHRHMAVMELLELLSAGGELEQCACLDALIALMLDSPVNQKEFEQHRGVRKIVELATNGFVDEKLRLKYAEFLLLLVGHVLPSTNKFIYSVEDERNEALLLDGTQKDIVELLGEDSASLLWAGGELGSSFDSEETKSLLHFQAERLLNSLKLSSL